MLKKIFNRFIHKLQKIYYQSIKNKLELKKLKRIKDPTLQSIISALLPFDINKLSREESEWVKKIEDMRNELRASVKEIEVINYGAGTPKSQLNTDGMHKGRTSTVTIGRACLASVPHEWGLLMFKIIRSFKPEVCIELGTCLGISSSYLASALEINKKGHVITIEGVPSYAKIAKENFDKLGLKRVRTEIGRFQDVLDDILKEIKTVDYAFIDGHHDEIATINYFNKIYPFLSQDAIIMFDDINWSKGMKNAWNTIKRDKRIKFTIDLYKLGICVVSTSLNNKNIFKFFLE